MVQLQCPYAPCCKKASAAFTAWEPPDRYLFLTPCPYTLSAHALCSYANWKAIHLLPDLQQQQHLRSADVSCICGSRLIQSAGLPWCCLPHAASKQASECNLSCCWLQENPLLHQIFGFQPSYASPAIAAEDRAAVREARRALHSPSGATAKAATRQRGKARADSALRKGASYSNLEEGIW